MNAARGRREVRAEHNSRDSSNKYFIATDACARVRAKNVKDVKNNDGINKVARAARGVIELRELLRGCRFRRNLYAPWRKAL